MKDFLSKVGVIFIEEDILKSIKVLDSIDTIYGIWEEVRKWKNL